MRPLGLVAMIVRGELYQRVMIKDICMSHGKEGKRPGEEEAAGSHQTVTRHECSQQRRNTGTTISVTI